ncbi:DNA polymerase III subunit gamma and tau [Acrocarpospora sp. B8E8]|uniref:DNA polymerase III subunit gamma and tau n=1 Tax=Acrocarpospora sp. B8E8 TaxID=3153572 RepID=UPI00325E00B2
MSLALYRKYRPGTFAEVKGQEHVTEPLRQALRSGRINHAYLFSGPRGCGKTSSARILARSLNCAEGPTPDPCGVCESCVALGPTGPGHLDVIEIDAASHGGVDDARDLRERAFFAPVSARFKIYIIDEAHMVTREGFNALLKLVEEPPPHLKFVFATTEPEKVIGTIKSRTHHYPFRLMPPATIRQIMEEILESESVPYEAAALPLVVRAGAGSARDSLSILDQLLAGTDDAGITYQRAVSLLGYTDGDLLDEIVDAFARRDGSLVFHAVNRVIEGGHDPRRFAMDLLERFRDLVILANVPEAAGNGLLDRPADELERLQGQAASMGPAELTRAAEVFNAGLTEMRGAASPRLLLELMCARLLLPAAAQGEAALLARLERLERLEREGPRPSSSTAPATTSAQAGPSTPSIGHATAPAGPGAASAATSRPDHEPGATSGSRPGYESGTASTPSAGAVPEPRSGLSTSSTGGRTQSDDDWPAAARPGMPSPQPPAAEPASAPAESAGMGTVMQAWPHVLEAVKTRQRVAWMILNAQGRLLGAEGNLVTVGFEKPGDVQGFLKGKRDEVVAAALGDVLGGNWRVDVVVGSGPTGGTSRPPVAPPPSGSPSGTATPPPPAHQTAPSQRPQTTPTQPSAAGTNGTPTATQAAPTDTSAPTTPRSAASTPKHPTPPEPKSAQPTTTDESWPDAPSDDFDAPTPPPLSAGPTTGITAAKSAARAAAQSGPRQAWPDSIPPRKTASDPDPFNDTSPEELSGLALLQRELGGRVIQEIDHSHP